ncbi:MAG TPA: RNB domain-containing ribonuclease [Miltoncostaeaceae bacterium]|nr:RNB domain-containing ribonuclease [Miltoncostaeaceae bacterium]
MPRGGPAAEVVAEMVAAGRAAAARPAFAPGADIPMSARTRGEAAVGDLVRMLVQGRQARILEVYGPARAPGAVMAALLADEGRGHGFRREVEAEVAAIADDDPLADPGRRDLRDQDVVTIDPQGAKDHDDAIAARHEGDDVRLWVHIADVSHYVPAGGAIDREAARRGTSVYVPGTVEPMLPARLSADLCSLRPGVDRRAVTAEMRVDPAGELHDVRFHRSVIRSEGRLTYPEVDAHLGGAPLPGGAGLAATVAAAREASRRLRERRRRRGALEVDGGEPVWSLAPDRVEGVHREHQTPSHALVEDCMIAANEAVARFLIARRAPTLFRFHEDPAQVRVERLHAQLEALDVAAPPLREGPLAPSERREAARAAGEAVTRHLAAARARGEPARGAALWGLVLRALAQAHYTADAVGHSGLASAAYTHFTSPIRRYPDLLVHRALLDALGLGPPGPDAAELSVAGPSSSESEREAAAIERRADRICAALLLEQELRGDPDAAVVAEVTGLVPGGAFVAWGEVFEGFLPARRMTDAELVLDPLEVALADGTGRRVLRLGDPVAVRVTDVEPLRGRVTVEPADGPRRPRLRRPAAGRRRA